MGTMAGVWFLFAVLTLILARIRAIESVEAVRQKHEETSAQLQRLTQQARAQRAAEMVRDIWRQAKRGAR